MTDAVMHGTLGERLFSQSGALILIIALTASIRAGLSLISDNAPGDPDSRAIIAAKWALDPYFIYKGVWLPFHFYAVGALTYLFDNAITAGKVLSFVTGTATVIPLFYLTTLLFDRSTAILAGIFFAIYGTQVGLSAITMSEAPCTFLCIWALYIFFVAFRSENPQFRPFFWSAVLLAMAGGFRQEAWQLTGILGLLMLFNPATRKYAIPFSLIGITTFLFWTAGNTIAGKGLLYSLTGVGEWKESSLKYTTHSATTNLIKWGFIFIQSPGPVLSVLAIHGFYLALKRRLASELAWIAVLMLSPYILLSTIKPEWVPQHRYSFLFGTMIIPYSAAATLRTLGTRWNIIVVTTVIVVITVLSQAALYSRHSRWSFPFHDYYAADIDARTWLAANIKLTDRILFDDLDYRTPGLISHSGVYTRKYTVVYHSNAEELKSAFDKLDPSILVTYSPISKLDFLLAGQDFRIVYQNEDCTIIRLIGK